MGVRDEVLRMLKDDCLSPGEIAAQRGVTLATILGYLNQMVGEGRLRRSDILFSVSSEKRSLIARALADGKSHQPWAVVRRLGRLASGSSVTEADMTVVSRYGSAGHSLGDMYEDIRTIEVGLHRLIRQGLEQEFGSGESGWWRQGIPVIIRQQCVLRREEDPTPALDPFLPLLIDLGTILDKQWKVLSRYLPQPVANDKNKKPLLADLRDLNRVRKMVMHPVRGGAPSEQDFESLRSLRSRLGFS